MCGTFQGILRPYQWISLAETMRPTDHVSKRRPRWHFNDWYLWFDDKTRRI